MANPKFIPKISDKKHHTDVLNRLPSDWESWPEDKASINDANALNTFVKRSKKNSFRWPKKPVVFISDAHADADAFEASLLAAGVIKRHGNHHCEYVLTKFGESAEIVVGGDCLDKGPSNLALLRSLAHLYRLKADVTLLAGNHDLRLLMGLLSLERDNDVGSQHFFVRMGKKVVPLFKEVFEQYLANSKWQKGVPSEDECRRALFPDEDWFESFPFYAAGFLTAAGIDRETSKMETKTHKFEQHCAAAGLTLQQVYAAAMVCRSLFLKRSGEFNWFFRKMCLVKQRGSFLFLHAGLDDRMAQLLAKRGIKYANRAFKKNLRSQNLFNFYYSPLANTFRTKYRNADLPLTKRGTKATTKAGIFVLVQGHINQCAGQRITLKKGLIHIEADITLDAHSRQREGLDGFGAGATLIDKKRGVVGISCDYPRAKVFKPGRNGRLQEAR
ncbi:metallophosphoesterase [Marinobacter sp. 2_MG-2023]|uniref:metallophosphoesterase n=1 Tax=Marinobacter sp. 2_MG-2023 TaxID=3062679 RepID=UPI0026E1BDF8|nr:metallophosphoesterase [Marinobacter sp. 2_MG-2023]MDO6443389.1 metallophosphoesterase [Marinobacter sp. 2_MG-2023]